MKIIYLQGDVTEPQLKEENDINYIVHCCNNVGKWGKGFVVPLANRWPATKMTFLSFYRRGINSELGDIQLIGVQKNITVVNMIGQHDIYPENDIPPIRPSAIRICLQKLRNSMFDKSSTYQNPAIHCPRFGSGLAGGDWKEMERILSMVFEDIDINIYVYDYKGPH